MADEAGVSAQRGEATCAADVKANKQFTAWGFRMSGVQMGQQRKAAMYRQDVVSGPVPVRDRNIINKPTRSL